MASRTLGSTGEVACMSRYSGLPDIFTPFIDISDGSSQGSATAAAAVEKARMFGGLRDAVRRRAVATTLAAMVRLIWGVLVCRRK